MVDASQDLQRQLISLKDELAASKRAEVELKVKLQKAQGLLDAKTGEGGSASSKESRHQRWWQGRICPSRSPSPPDSTEASCQDVCWQIVMSMQNVNALLCNMDDYTICDASRGACKLWGSACLYGNPFVSLLNSSSRRPSVSRALDQFKLSSTGGISGFSVKDVGIEEFKNKEGKAFDAELLIFFLPAEPRFDKSPKLLVIAYPEVNEPKNSSKTAKDSSKILKEKSRSGSNLLPKESKHLQMERRSNRKNSAGSADLDLGSERCQLAATCEDMAQSVCHIVLHLTRDLKVCSPSEAQLLGRQEALFGQVLSGDLFENILDPEHVDLFSESLTKASETGILCCFNVRLQSASGRCPAMLMAMDTGGFNETRYCIGIRFDHETSITSARRNFDGSQSGAESFSPSGSPWGSQGENLYESRMHMPFLNELEQSLIIPEPDDISGALPSVATGHTDMNDAHNGFAGGFWKVQAAIGLGIGDYKAVRAVGVGGQGVVFHVRDQAGTSFALKKVNLPGSLFKTTSDFPMHLRNADREARVLKSLAWASAVIVRFHDCWIQDDFKYACIVMEWLPKTLSAHLKAHTKEAKQPVPVQDARRWITHVTTGLAIIHSKNFMHRDIKPSNLLLTEDTKFCKIADLGLGRALHEARPPADNASRVSKDNFSQVSGAGAASQVSGTSVEAKSVLSGYTEFQGTMDYMSPEAAEGAQYNAATDIFSAGCVLLELLTMRTLSSMRIGKAPVSRGLLKSALQVSGNGSSICHALAEICTEMLSESPDDRPAARLVLKRAVLQETVDDLLESHGELRFFFSTVNNS